MMTLTNVDLFSKVQPELHVKQSVAETVPRVLQCIGILASVQTGDDRQEALDSLIKTLKQTWFRTRIAGDRRGYIGSKGDQTISHTSSANNLGVF